MPYRHPYLTGVATETIQQGQFVSFDDENTTLDRPVKVADGSDEATFGVNICGVATNSALAGEVVGIRGANGGTCETRNMSGIEIYKGDTIYVDANGWPTTTDPTVSGGVELAYSLSRSGAVGEWLEVKLLHGFTPRSHS